MTLKIIVTLLLIGLVDSQVTLSKLPVQNSTSVLVAVNTTTPSTYGSVCGDDVTNTTSDVICRELGYGTGQVKEVRGEDRVVTGLEVVLWDVRCSDGVKGWSGCQYSSNSSTGCNTGPLLLTCTHHRHGHGSRDRCPAGSAHHGTKCVKCTRGWYSTGHGHPCTRCPAHLHSEPGAAECSMCRLGEAYLNSTCTSCPNPGFYGDGESCLACSGDNTTEFTQRLCGRGLLQTWGRVLVGCAGGFTIAILLLLIIRVVNNGAGRFRRKQQKTYKQLSEEQPGSANTAISSDYV